MSKPIRPGSKGALATRGGQMEPHIALASSAHEAASVIVTDCFFDRSEEAARGIREGRGTAILKQADVTDLTSAEATVSKAAEANRSATWRQHGVQPLRDV
ncbi:hypothetical protein ACYCVF_36550 [Bradyrhizobium sp. 1.29L]